MNKTEIQWRILTLQAKFDSEMASLKEDLARCDCAYKAQAGEIEQEKCWHRLFSTGDIADLRGKTKDTSLQSTLGARSAYMPECRQVEPEDARIAEFLAFLYEGDANEFAYELHKRGFRIKVNP